MGKFKKTICILMAVFSVISAVSISAFACDETEETEFISKYPFVFVHGFNGWGRDEGIDGVIPYWGATTGDLMKYLQSEGYECYSASVGPFSSAWDRSCELYAQLTGTTVDYGAAHSAKHNHERYGRTYSKPMIENLGEINENGEINKINLIGHSFGGTTIRMMVHLLTNGSEEERKATTDGTLSELFTGGKDNIVNSVVTICTPHNSSSIYQFTLDFHLFNVLQLLSVMYAGSIGRSALNGRFVDFHLEQFGITNTPGKHDADGYIKSIINFMENSDDSCQHDLTPDGMKAINDIIDTNPNIYYFSYPFKSTYTSKITGITWPKITTNPLITPLACYMAHHKEFTDTTTGQVYDDEWRDSDSLCNTISETYPFDEKHTEYTDGTDIQKGIWYVMPTQEGDHGQAIGLLASKDKTHKFYLEMVQMVNNLK